MAEEKMDNNETLKQVIEATNIQIQVLDGLIKSNEQLTDIYSNIWKQFDVINEQLSLIKDVCIPASVIHQNVFPKYKDCLKGKNIVIVGGGPTVDKYVPIENAVHMAINNAIYREDITFDFFLACDFDGEYDLFDYVMSKNDLTKFFGISNSRKGQIIPDFLRNHNGVESFYAESFERRNMGFDIRKGRKFMFNPDLSCTPIKSYGTSYYIAFQIALWMHPERIYVVGADCSGAAHGDSIKVTHEPAVKTDFSYLVEPWKELRDFANDYYPDIQIISVNPVGLRGIFEDYYSE